MSLEHDADGHLGDVVHSIAVAFDLGDADVILSIRSSAKLGHYRTVGRGLFMSSGRDEDSRTQEVRHREEEEEEEGEEEEDEEEEISTINICK